MFYSIRYYSKVNGVWELFHMQCSTVSAAFTQIKLIESDPKCTFVSMKKVG